jgi:hypothetical protein
VIATGLATALAVKETGVRSATVLDRSDQYSTGIRVGYAVEISSS